MALALAWFEHAGGDARHHSSRHQPLALRAKIISQPRDHVTFAGRQGFQPGARYFLRGFRFTHEFFLACHHMKFRLRRSWTKRANANAVRFHFFCQAFREQQVKCFRRRIGGNIWNGLKGCGGSQNQNVALRRATISGRNSRVKCTTAEQLTCTMSSRRPQFNGVQFAIRAKTGIVDEQFNGNSCARVKA